MIQVQVIGDASIEAPAGRLTPANPLLFWTALYLVDHAGERISRATLIELLWPRVARSKQGTRLRQLLRRLRAMGLPFTTDPGDAGAAPVALDAASITLDITYYTTLHNLLAPDLRYAEAIAPILDGALPDATDKLTDWAESYRARQAETVVTQLAVAWDIATQRGNGPMVLALTSAARRLMPEHHEATLVAARQLAIDKHFEQAALLLREHARALGDDDPDAKRETTVLLRRIERQGTTAAATTAVQAPFSGRDQQIEEFHACLNGLLLREGAVLEWCGPPGIGKTRLLQECLRRAQLLTALTGAVAAQPDTVEHPLGLVRDLLRMMLPWPGAAGADPTSLAIATELIGMTDPQVTGPTMTIPAVRDALYDLLAAVVAEERMVVIGIEDLQWADRESLLVLGAIARWSQEQPVLWLLTRRLSTDATMPRAFEGAVQRWVPPFPPDDAAMLVARLINTDPTARATLQAEHPTAFEQLALQGGGMPFVLVELTRHAMRTGTIDLAPRRLGTMVATRLQALPSGAQRVLQAIALLDKHATLPRVEALAGLEPSALSDAIGSLELAGIVAPGPGARLDVHQIWLEQVRNDMPEALHRLWHSRAALMLDAQTAATPTPDLFRAVAQHWEAAGEVDRATAAWLRVATDAEHRGAFEDAAIQFDRARQSATRTEDITMAIEHELRAIRRTGNWDRIAARTAALLPLLREQDAPPTTAQLEGEPATGSQAPTPTPIGHTGAMLPAGFRTATTDDERAAFLWEFAQWGFPAAPQEFVAAFADAVTPLAPTTSAGQRALLRLHQLVATLRGDIPAMRAGATQLEAAADAAGPLEHQASDSLAAADAWRVLGDYPAAMRAAHRALAVAAVGGEAMQYQIIAHTHLATTTWALVRDVAAADAWAQAGLRLATTPAPIHARIVLDLHMTSTYFHMVGSPQHHALPNLPAETLWIDAIHNPRRRLLYLAVYAQHARIREAHDELLDTITRLRELLAAEELPVGIDDAALQCVLGLDALGERTEAERIARTYAGARREVFPLAPEWAPFLEMANVPTGVAWTGARQMPAEHASPAEPPSTPRAPAILR